MSKKTFQTNFLPVIPRGGFLKNDNLLFFTSQIDQVRLLTTSVNLQGIFQVYAYKVGPEPSYKWSDMGSPCKWPTINGFHWGIKAPISGVIHLLISYSW